MSPDDVCACGDYRRQHVNGSGRCKLDDLCTPSRCQRFRLACADDDMRAAEREHDQMAALERRERADRGIDEEGAWKP